MSFREPEADYLLAEKRQHEWQEKIDTLNKTIKRNEAKHRKEMRAKKLEIQELKFGKIQNPTKRKKRNAPAREETGEKPGKEQEKKEGDKEGVKMTPEERKSLVLSEIISTEVTYIECLTLAIDVCIPWYVVPAHLTCSAVGILGSVTIRQVLATRGGGKHLQQYRGIEGISPKIPC